MREGHFADGWDSGTNRVSSAFTSSYVKSYTGSYGPPGSNARVRTSQFYPSACPDVNSTYRTDYVVGNVSSASRTSVTFGSTSGQRKNNPHPHNMVQAFAHPTKDGHVWCHYPRLPPVTTTQAPPLNGPYSDELLRKVCQAKTRSTYQQDFVVNSLESPFINLNSNSSVTSRQQCSATPIRQLEDNAGSSQISR